MRTFSNENGPLPSQFRENLERNLLDEQASFVDYLPDFVGKAKVIGIT